MYKIKYTFESILNQLKQDTYVSRYLGIISTSRGDLDEKVGEVNFDVIHCNQALNQGFEIMDIFESEELLSQLAADIYDYENYNLKKDILKEFSEVLPYSDLLIIRSISILPGYRKLNISQMVIKDLVKRFSESCALIIAYISPMQLPSVQAYDKAWVKQLKLYDFNKDYELSNYKIKAHLKKLNFNHISGFENYMFFNPLEDQVFLQLSDINNTEEFSAS